MKQFGLTIANSTGSTQVIALLTAFFLTLSVSSVSGAEDAADTVSVGYSLKTQINTAGFSDVTYAADDGTLVSGLTVTAVRTKYPVRDFIQWVKYTSPVIRKITVQADNDAHFSQSITVVKVSPLGNQGEEVIYLADYYTTAQFNDNKVVIGDLDIIAGPETLMYMPVATGRTVTVTFHF